MLAKAMLRWGNGEALGEGWGLPLRMQLQLGPPQEATDFTMATDFPAAQPLLKTIVEQGAIFPTETSRGSLLPTEEGTVHITASEPVCYLP